MSAKSLRTMPTADHLSSNRAPLRNAISGTGLLILKIGGGRLIAVLRLAHPIILTQTCVSRTAWQKMLDAKAKGTGNKPLGLQLPVKSITNDEKRNDNAEARHANLQWIRCHPDPIAFQARNALRQTPQRVASSPRQQDHLPVPPRDGVRQRKLFEPCSTGSANRQVRNWGIGERRSAVWLMFSVDLSLHAPLRQFRKLRVWAASLRSAGDVCSGPSRL